jgi:hypothetical protein
MKFPLVRMRRLMESRVVPGRLVFQPGSGLHFAIKASGTGGLRRAPARE